MQTQWSNIMKIDKFWITNIPSGGKRRYRSVSLLRKTGIFAKAKLLIHFTKMVEFSLGKPSVFFMMSSNLQGIFSWKLARFFPSLTSPCASATCDRSSPKGFLWSLANAIARPWCFASALDSLGCWLWSQDYMEWPILTAATLHRPHLCELEPSYFQFYFSYTNFLWSGIGDQQLYFG